MKVQRWEVPLQGACYLPEECDDGQWCDSVDVARLEASHAELLEAAKDLLDLAERWGWQHIAVSVARAAIAKAEGKEEQP